MGEEPSGMLGSKGDGYSFMLEVSYMWSSSASMLWPVLFNTFTNDFEKSEFTYIKIANDTKLRGCSQQTLRQECHPGGPGQSGGLNKAKLCIQEGLTPPLMAQDVD